MDARKLASLFDNEMFAKWFGNSKVVDAAGNPLTVYHGTASDFSSFDNAKTGANDRGMWGRGHYFSTSKDNANSYALRQGEGASVIPAYISMQNPFVLKTGKDFTTRLPDGRNSRDFIGENLDGSKIKEMALAMGHDGVIQIKPDGTIGDLVAYQPTQIKSVFNEGSFDPTNPNILKSALPIAAAGGLMAGMSPSDASAIQRIRENDAPLQDAWNPLEAFAGGLGGGVRSALAGVLPDGAMDWAINRIGGLMSGGK